MPAVFVECPGIDISWAQDATDIHWLEPGWQPDSSAPVILDAIQTWRPELQHRSEAWHRRWFSRQVFVNADWVQDLDQFLVYNDLPNTHVVITGAVDWEPRHLRIWRYENSFRQMQLLYTQVPAARRTPRWDLEVRPHSFDAMLGAVDGRPARSWLLERCAPRSEIITRFYRGDVDISRFPDQFEPPDGMTPHDHVTRPWNRDGVKHFFTSLEYQFHDRSVAISQIMPWNIYDRSAFSIVSETSSTNSYCFYTEKTVKPIMAGRLFVMFAGQHYLRYLRELGFRTFDGIIDERYDEEPDPERRWHRAWQQVLMLLAQDQAQVLTACRARVQHNHDWFWTQDWDAIYRRAMINAVTL